MWRRFTFIIGVYLLDFFPPLTWNNAGGTEREEEMEGLTKEGQEEIKEKPGDVTNSGSKRRDKWGNSARVE